MVKNDCQLTVQKTAGELNMDIEGERLILIKDLNLKKVHARMIWKNGISNENSLQKDCWKNPVVWKI